MKPQEAGRTEVNARKLNMNIEHLHASRATSTYMYNNNTIIYKVNMSIKSLQGCRMMLVVVNGIFLLYI